MRRIVTVGNSELTGVKTTSQYLMEISLPPPGGDYRTS